MREVNIFKIVVLHRYVACCRVCAYVVMNAEHDCGEGDKECVAWPQYHL